MEAKLMFSFLLILHFTSCSSKDTITMNQTLQDGHLLISKQNNFALGFFSPGSSNYRYLGIWYHKVPVQTVVWVANRNNPINGSSGILSINQQQGDLVLYDNKNPVWSTNVSVEVNGTSSAQLLDSGNFVLVQARNQRILWQGFDHPTDTFLPGIKLGLNRKTGLDKFLTSWKSADDPGTGNYSLRLNPNGSPQFFIYKGSKVIWKTGPWPWTNFEQPYNYSFVNTADEMYSSLSDGPVIKRVVLVDLGFLKWLTWLETKNQWKEFWASPRDRCEISGQCGANSKCGYNSVNMFECTCLPGYEPKSKREWFIRDGSGGCIRKRLESYSVCVQGEGFIKVDGVNLPDSSQAAWVSMSMSHTDCEKECKRNCSCSAYASINIPGNGTGCLAWYGELIDTRNHIGYIGHDLYVRVDAVELAENARKSSSFLGTKGKGMISILILSVASAWFLSIYIWIRIRKKKRMMNKRSTRSSVRISGLNYHRNKVGVANEVKGGSRNHPDITVFNLNTILAATDNFSAANKIGQGGFGTVYKGQLSNGQEIAVKRMSEKSIQGIEEFKNEAILIAKLQHRNLVKLLGCCIRKKEQILVYEYLPNRSLDSFIFDETRRSFLDWEKCFSIIVGIARGILYLHQDSRLRIIHRDLKCSNILLDVEMNPKISDFGMARLLQNDQIQEKTSRVVGTYGYMSPEYAIFGKFSVKSDVFSYGVILLEIISGIKSNGFTQNDASLSLIGQVWELWSEGRALEMIHSSLKGSYKPEEPMRCIQVGLLCVQEDAKDRPTMLEVNLMLNSKTPLPCPKQPAFIFRASSSNANTKEEEEECCSINQVTMSTILTR